MGTSVSWYGLDVSKFKIYFSISSLHTSGNEKGPVDLPLRTSPIVNMLGLFLYFKMIFFIESVIFLELESLIAYLGIIGLVTNNAWQERDQSLSDTTVFRNGFIIFYQYNLFFRQYLVQKNTLYCSPKGFPSIIFCFAQK